MTCRHFGTALYGCALCRVGGFWQFEKRSASGTTGTGAGTSDSAPTKVTIASPWHPVARLLTLDNHPDLSTTRLPGVILQTIGLERIALESNAFISDLKALRPTSRGIGYHQPETQLYAALAVSLDPDLRACAERRPYLFDIFARLPLSSLTLRATKTPANAESTMNLPPLPCRAARPCQSFKRHTTTAT